MIKIFKILVVLVIFIAIGFTSAYYWVDARIASLLSSDPKSRFPAIYSDVLRVTNRSQLSTKGLIKELARRGYIQTDQMPNSPGEFHLINPNTIGLWTRTFLDPQGVMHQAQSVKVSTESGVILDENNNELNLIEIEPDLIERFDTQESRASQRLKIDDFPQTIQSAVLAIEDERFYSHFGIDFEGIFRAIIANIRALAWVQGGSTISQQLAKNIFLSPERTLSRKFLEFFSALSLERRLNKDQILELYLNEVYLGQEGSVAIHGVAEASKVFFGKEIKFITVAEAALLAGMIKGPSLYSPRKHFKRAMIRKNVVLKKMYELEILNDKQYTQAVSQQIKIAPGQHYKRKAPYLLTTLRNELESYLDVNAALSQGVSIFTGLDSAMQECAENAVVEGLKELERSIPSIRHSRLPIQAALVAIEPFSGKVRAWVGGRDFSRNQFDRVSLAKRQIGSTIKPFLYLAALDQTLQPKKILTPITIVSDRPVNIDIPGNVDWSPENYDHDYRGDVTIRYALEQSLNIPAVLVSQWIGIGSLVNAARAFRLSDNLPPVPSLALGATDTSLLRLSAAYGALANGGIYVTPRIFTTILDSQGKQLAKSLYEEQRVASESATFVLINLLQGVIERGTAKSIRSRGFTQAAAGKTGTSNDTRDAWFAGFTPDLVAGVWVGFDDNRKFGLTGGRTAAPIWADFMKCVAPYHDNLNFIPPSSGVVFADLDYQTRGRATNNCPSQNIIKEVFVAGTEPGPCKLHSGRYLEPEFDHQRDQRVPAPSKRRSLWERIFG